MQFSTIYATAVWVSLALGESVNTAAQVGSAVKDCISSNGSNCPSAPQIATFFKGLSGPVLDNAKNCISNTCANQCTSGSANIVECSACFIQNCRSGNAGKFIQGALNRVSQRFGGRINKRELERRGLKEKATKLKNELKKKLSTATEVLRSTGRKGVETAVEVGRQQLSNIGKAAGNAVETTVRNAANDLKNGNFSLGNSVKEGVKSTVGSVAPIIKEGAKNVTKSTLEHGISGAKDAFGKPKTEEAAVAGTEEDEEDADALEKRGLKDIATKVKNTVGAAGKKAAEKLRPAVEAAASSAAKTVNAAAKDVGRAVVTGVKSAAPVIGNTVKTTLGGVAKDIMNGDGINGSTIKKGLQSNSGQFEEIGRGFVKEIRNSTRSAVVNGARDAVKAGGATLSSKSNSPTVEAAPEVDEEDVEETADEE